MCCLFTTLVPAANFWSVTLYDASNASRLDNDQPFPSIDSLDDLKYNNDSFTYSANVRQN